MGAAWLLQALEERERRAKIKIGHEVRLGGCFGDPWHVTCYSGKRTGSLVREHLT